MYRNVSFRKRVAAFEILLDTPRVKDLILKGEVGLLKEAMANGVQEGMQTFDEHIHQLFSEGLIAYENAIAFADSPNDLRLRIKMNEIKDKPYTRSEPSFRLKREIMR